MKLKPLNKYVYIRLETDSDQTAGGIYMPPGQQTDSQIGIVEAIASDVTNGVQLNERVFFRKFVGEKIGTSHILLKQQDVLGVIDA